MQNNNMPQVINPTFNLPELPQLFQNAMPIEIPRANFNQGHFSLFFGNIKRGQIAKAVKIEAEIAESTHHKIIAQQGSLFELITFGSKVENHFAQIKHNSVMRDLEVQEKQADIYTKQAQAQLIGYEAKIAELDYNTRLKQYKKMEEEDGTATP
jgi:hypothetical protein